MSKSNPEDIAGQLLSLMVVHFGVRPDGAVLLKDLTVLAEHTLRLEDEDFASVVAFAVGSGYVVNQSNGLLRITEAGYRKAYRNNS